MPHRTVLASVLCVLSAAGPALAGDASAATAMDALLAKHHKPDAPGCAAGVYRGGALLHAGAFGMANLELQVPITPTSAFDIGSTSKQFTALSALLLERDGKLSLDDAIRKHVPELPAYAENITLRQLLHHTGGIRDYIDLLRMSGAHEDDVTTAQRALDLLTRQQGTHFAPGARHEYSNSGYFLVALAVERVSGLSMREFARTRIFQPLNMRQSLYRDDHAELVPNRAMAYAADDKKTWRLDVSNWEQMGDGGIVTTVGEFAHWNGNFYTPVVGDAALLADLHARGTLNDGSRLTYALGLMHGTYKGHASVHHGGSWGGYIADFVRYPEQQLGIAVLCNSPDQPLTELTQQIADLYLPAAPAVAAAVGATKRDAPALTDAQRTQWVGSYRSEGSGDVATVRLNKGALEVVHTGTAYPLQPVDQRTVRVGNVPVEVLLTLEPASAGQPRRLSQTVDGNEQASLVAFQPATPTPAQLQGRAGTYHCPELGADYRVQVTGPDLQLVSPRGDVTVLAPREEGSFVGKRMAVQFADDAAGAASTLQLGTARAQGIRCARR